jgi:hypothetical protein
MCEQLLAESDSIGNCARHRRGTHMQQLLQRVYSPRVVQPQQEIEGGRHPTNEAAQRNVDVVGSRAQSKGRNA